MTEPTKNFIAQNSIAHESANLQITGAARYIDDIPELPHTLHAAFGLANVTHAKIISLDLSAVEKADGVIAVLTQQNLRHATHFGAVLHDDVLFAHATNGGVQHWGQPLFAVAANSHTAARRAARLFKLESKPLPVNLSAAEGAAAGETVVNMRNIVRGDIADFFNETADEIKQTTQASPASPASQAKFLSGTLNMGGQEHFYLEGQIAYAIPTEDGLVVHSSTQHPSEVQAAVAEFCGLPFHAVQVLTRRMGGGFGGKESQAMPVAIAAALLALKTRRPVKMRLDRDDDFLTTGKRHEFDVTYQIAFNDVGKILAQDTRHLVRGGISADFTGPVADRALFHANNAYDIANVRFESIRAKTHTVSNTAFRGFGGPQGMLPIECMMEDVARSMSTARSYVDALDVRYKNLFAHDSNKNLNHEADHKIGSTFYGQPVKDYVLHALMQQLEKSSNYRARRMEIQAWNATNPIIKRGLSMSPVMFGVAFGFTPHNQGTALVSLLKDGSLTVQHGGTEMGQGLNTKVSQTVADVFADFGVTIAQVKIQATDTAVLPNMPATAASSGTDLNASAAKIAATELRSRLADLIAVNPKKNLADVANAAYLARISLTATGYYSTPDLGYDFVNFQGSPFQYFTYGASVSEVRLDVLSGETHVCKVDILQDVGRSINPALDIAQIEGGFVQGMGWLTTEELVWKSQGAQRGRLMTQAPQTYKIPTARDVPEVFNVALFDNVNAQDGVDINVNGSKAVGEPPFMLANSVFLAIRDAVSACLPANELIKLNAPATPEAVLKALQP